MFTVGLAVFTAGSAAAGLAPTINLLVLARAVQGIGGAILTPLTLTVLSASVPEHRRGTVIGAWGGIGSLGAALGPVVGGALTATASWQWIFWLNVPIGLLLLPAAHWRLTESYGPRRPLDLPGVALASASLFALVWGLIRGGGHGWTNGPVLLGIGAGGLGFVAFVRRERLAPEPMLAPRGHRSPSVNSPSCSASPCLPRPSPRTATTPHPPPSSPASPPPCGSAPPLPAPAFSSHSRCRYRRDRARTNATSPNGSPDCTASTTTYEVHGGKAQPCHPTFRCATTPSPADNEPMTSE